METLPVKLILFAVGIAFVLAAASSADAKVRKHKRQPVAQPTALMANSGYRGTHLFPAGPVYNGPDYIGDDPDPFIRFQLKRDLSGRYGGED